MLSGAGASHRTWRLCQLLSAPRPRPAPQLAQLCRQGPKQRSSSQPILVSAAPAGEELMHATRSHKRKRAGQAQAEAGAAGNGAPGMRSVHFAR